MAENSKRYLQWATKSLQRYLHGGAKKQKRPGTAPDIFCLQLSQCEPLLRFPKNGWHQVDKCDMFKPWKSWGIDALARIRCLAPLAFTLMVIAAPASAGIPADPEGSGVIVGALSWLQGTLLGTAATVAAVIAVAAVGFAMLTGRINWRHGAVVILGCFILFGAATIVGGIQSAAGG